MTDRPTAAKQSRRRLSREELAAFQGKTVPDVIAAGLDVIFCGINPSLSSAAERRHFATPGNRFWPSLHRGGFTPRQLAPGENEELLSYGCGVTNLVRRATAAASELQDHEYSAGVARLRRKCLKYRPRCVAVLGIGAYRLGFGEPKATLGPQERTLGPTRLYVLPNPSGLNAHYTPAAMAELFAELHAFVGALREDRVQPPRP